MPTYLITDKRANERVMVEGARPLTALQTLIGDRFEVSSALEVAEAVRLSRQGVELLEAGDDIPPSANADAAPSRPPLDAFAPADEDPEFAEVEPEPKPGPGFSVPFQDLDPNDPVDAAYAALR